MDSDLDQDQESQTEPSTQKKKRAQRSELSKEEKKRTLTKLFRHEWLNLKDFKYWLQELPNDKAKCKCKACNVILVCGKSELEKHSIGKKHISDVKELRGTPNLNVFSQNSKSGEKIKLDNDVQSAEIRLAAFFANHNVAFQAVDTLTPILHDIFYDSKIAQGIQLHRKKCTCIINNILVPVEIEETITIIRRCPFSVMVDESTGICSRKFLCVLVNYVHPDYRTMHTKLLEHVWKMCEEFKMCLSTKQISLTNSIGVACDGANLMVGKNNSFFCTFIK